MSNHSFPDGTVKFASISSLTSRFDFVEDDILKTNVSTTFQYVIFLLSLNEAYKMPGPIIYSIYKNIIVLSVSIVESLTCYKLQKMIQDKRYTNEEIMKMEYKYTQMNEIYPISDDEVICACLRTERHEKLNEKTQLIALNRAAKRSGLFNKTHYEIADKLRQIRNKIHLAALNKIDDQYTKEEVDQIFSDSKKLIDRIESY